MGNRLDKVGEDMVSDLKDAFKAIDGLRLALAEHEKRLIRAGVLISQLRRDHATFRTDLEKMCAQLKTTEEKLAGKLDTLLEEHNQAKGAKRLLAWLPTGVMCVLALYTAFSS